MGRRLLSALTVACLLSLFSTVTHAQQASTIQTTQTESMSYGESVTFNVVATAPVPLDGARITVQFVNRSKLVSESIPVPEPGTTISLSHTISTQSLQAPPFGQLIYFWDFRDQYGNEYRSLTKTLQYEDTSVPWNWVVTSQGQTMVYTDGRDETVSRAALEIAVTARAEASQRLGVMSSAPVHVYVYPTLAQLANALRLHQLQVQDWVAAYAIPDQHVVLVSAASGPELLINLQRDIPHEITHLAVYDAAGEFADSVPGWFNEGLALTSSAEPDPTLYNALDNALRNGMVLPVQRLCAHNYSGFSPQEAVLAYAQSESLIRYITERYGIAQVRVLMNGYANGLSCSEAVEQALGIPLEELEEQWRNHLLRQLARTPRRNSSLLPWIVVWVVSLGLALLFIAPQPAQPESEALLEPRTPRPQREASDQLNRS